EFKVVVIGDELLDDLYRHRLFFVLENTLQHLLRERQGDLLPGQRRERNQSNQRSFELADVRLDFAGDVHRDVVGQRNCLGFGFFLQDRDLGLEVRRLNVSDQSPFESRSQAFLERCDVPRRAVTAEDDLLLRVVQRVERMEELRLRSFFSREKLNVVDEQYVDRTVT